MAYYRYGYVNPEPVSSGSGGSGLTPAQEALLDDLSNGVIPGVSNTNNHLNNLVTYNGNTFETIKPVRHYTSEVSRHHMVDVLEWRYKEAFLNNVLSISDDGSITSTNVGAAAMAIPRYPCLVNSYVQFEITAGSIDTTNDHLLYFGVINPDYISTTTFSDNANWVLDPGLYQDNGLLIALHFSDPSKTYDVLYDGNAMSTTTGYDYKNPSVTNLGVGSKIFLGIGGDSKLEVLYMNEAGNIMARHKYNTFVYPTENKFFFIAPMNSLATFKLSTKFESNAWPGTISPSPKQLVSLRDRSQTIDTVSTRDGSGVVITPINIVDAFSVWINANISGGNKNGVFNTNSYTISGGELWNSMAVVPTKVEDGCYYEFKVLSGGGNDHGVWVGYIEKNVFEALPDSSQWAVTNPGLTGSMGARLEFNAGSGSATVNGVNETTVGHTTQQRNMQTGDILQFGVKGSTIELTVFDDATKTVIFNISYTHGTPFTYTGTKYPAIATNKFLTYEHHLTPNVYLGTQLSSMSHIASVIEPMKYPLYNEKARGKVFYNSVAERPFIAADRTISQIVTFKESNLLPLFNKAKHIGSLFMVDGVIYVGTQNGFTVIA